MKGTTLLASVIYLSSFYVRLLLNSIRVKNETIPTRSLDCGEAVSMNETRLL